MCNKLLSNGLWVSSLPVSYTEERVLRARLEAFGIPLADAEPDGTENFDLGKALSDLESEILMEPLLGATDMQIGAASPASPDSNSSFIPVEAQTPASDTTIRGALCGLRSDVIPRAATRALRASEECDCVSHDG